MADGDWPGARWGKSEELRLDNEERFLLPKARGKLPDSRTHSSSHFFWSLVSSRWWQFSIWDTSSHLSRNQNPSTRRVGRTIPAMIGCGSLIKSLHGSGQTNLISGFDYDSPCAAGNAEPAERRQLWRTDIGRSWMELADCRSSFAASSCLQITVPLKSVETHGKQPLYP